MAGWDAGRLLQSLTDKARGLMGQNVPPRDDRPWRDDPNAMPGESYFPQRYYTPEDHYGNAGMNGEQLSPPRPGYGQWFGREVAPPVDPALLHPSGTTLMGMMGGPWSPEGDNVLNKPPVDLGMMRAQPNVGPRMWQRRNTAEL